MFTQTRAQSQRRRFAQFADRVIASANNIDWKYGPNGSIIGVYCGTRVAVSGDLLCSRINFTYQGRRQWVDLNPSKSGRIYSAASRIADHRRNIDSIIAGIARLDAERS
jgi:hypothetical protein